MCAWIYYRPQTKHEAKQCFFRCLSVNRGKGYLSLWSQVLSDGGLHWIGWGTPFIHPQPEFGYSARIGVPSSFYPPLQRSKMMCSVGGMPHTFMLEDFLFGDLLTSDVNLKRRFSVYLPLMWIWREGSVFTYLWCESREKVQCLLMSDVNLERRFGVYLPWMWIWREGSVFTYLWCEYGEKVWCLLTSDVNLERRFSVYLCLMWIWREGSVFTYLGCESGEKVQCLLTSDVNLERRFGAPPGANSIQSGLRPSIPMWTTWWAIGSFCPLPEP